MSKFTEKEILKEAVIAIDEKARLTTSELIDELRIRMRPDGHDIQIIKGRKDDYFSQKVRNLKSHKTLEKYTIMIEENKRNTIWYSRQTGKNIIDLNKNSLKLLDEKAFFIREHNRKFIPKIINHLEIQKDKQEIGLQGEIIVLNAEIRKFKNLKVDDVIIEHTSKKRGDGAGYDISILNPNGEYNFIEVKTTTGRKETAFYMSENEKAFAIIHYKNYTLARVYEFNKEERSGKIEYYTGEELLNEFGFFPSSYKVKRNE